MSTRRSIATKILNGLSGLSLALFVAIHLIGNLTLFAGAGAFNAYAHFLQSFLHGAFIYMAEAGLILFFLLHIVTAIAVRWSGRQARVSRYQVSADAGGPSRKTLSSKTMLITGILLLVYTVYHVNHFKYGPGIAEGYVTQLHGEPVRDIYRLVVEEFQIPLITFGYAAFMIFLGMHLRHGFWSGMQSLGATSPRLQPAIIAGGTLLAILLAVGFILVPLYIYFFLDAPAVGATSLGG